MKLKNCSFKTWSKNHLPDHKDRIYRELYPYKVFEQINFSNEKIRSEQIILFNNDSYFIEIKKIELQDNNRYRATFEFDTVSNSERQRWKHRVWNEKFQIIYSVYYEFITVFTKKEDSSKDYVKRFFKGNFKKITLNKSIPISDLLFRSLVINLSEDLYGIGDYYKTFSYINSEYNQLLDSHQIFLNNIQKFSPMYSQERDLWICHSFVEEKAHRLGIFLAKQCSKLLIVYCNPTYTKHHRCKYKNVEIVSLFEFAYKKSKLICGNYEKQIRFLQNHLNSQEDYSIDELISEIENPKFDSYKIYKSELMEALSIMKIIPTSTVDCFHYFSSMNLLNAWINKNKDKGNRKQKQLFKDMYSFKAHLSKTLNKIIKNKNLASKIYLSKTITIIELSGFQFSFHNLPLNGDLQQYVDSSSNTEIIWGGKRLQPIAPLLFRYSKELSFQHYKKSCD
jgi:hypothetical protein